MAEFDIALETSVQEVKEILGGGTDAIISEVERLKEDIETVNGEVSTINSNVSTIKSEVSTIKTKVNSMSSGLTSCIKSIQRGTCVGTNKSTANITVTINEVDPNKCIVLLDNQIISVTDAASSAYYYVYGSRLVSLTATKLTVTPNYIYQNSSSTSVGNHGTIAYQIIEFY